MDECRRFVEIPASFINFCYAFEERALGGSCFFQFLSVIRTNISVYGLFFGQASLKLIIVQYAAAQFMAIATEHDV